MMRVLFAFLLSVSIAQAFVARSTASRRAGRAIRELAMAPKYDGTKWVATKPEEGPEAGYDELQTLLMHGPKPFFSRVFQSEDYEQAVLKFMAGDKVGRVEAQGNMVRIE